MIDQKILSQFTGTEQWHRYNVLMPNALLTDGALYIAQAGVPFILYSSETGRVFGQPSVLPLRDSDYFITKLTENCFGDNVSSAGDIEYFLTEVSPGWVTDILEASELYAWE